MIKDLKQGMKVFAIHPESLPPTGMETNPRFHMDPSLDNPAVCAAYTFVKDFGNGSVALIPCGELTEAGKLCAMKMLEERAAQNGLKSIQDFLFPAKALYDTEDEAWSALYAATGYKKDQELAAINAEIWDILVRYDVHAYDTQKEGEELERLKNTDPGNSQIAELEERYDNDGYCLMSYNSLYKAAHLDKCKLLESRQSA